MSNLVLYRKYRPQFFSDVIGQEHVIQTLTNAISSEIISHAYLFCGPRGSGKTTIARLLAKAFNCQDRKKGQSEPCNKCSSCLEIMQGNSIDLIEIDAASHRGIDEMRELKDGIKFAPTKSKYKVFIIDESHQLTKEAANALLKTLEEPPAHAIFILATTEIHKMISTIISRCQRFDFRKLTLSEIVKRMEIIIKKENAKAQKSALELIALNSSGSMRDAEGLLDQVLIFSDSLGAGEEDKSSSSPFTNVRVKKEIKAEDIKDLLGLVEIALISQFCDFIIEKKAAEAIDFLNEITDRGLDLQEFSKSLINYLRQVLIFRIAGLPAIGLTKEQFQKLQQQASNFNEQEFRVILKLFLEADNKIKYSSIPQLPLELAVIEACEEQCGVV